MRDAALSVGAGVVTIDEATTRWRDAMSAEDKSVRTIESYALKVAECADWAGWRTAADVTYESATGFLAARKRNDHEGIAWENGAVRQAVSALRHFGKFLAASGLSRFDPMANLALPKRKPQRHKHPFTESEARGLVGASLGRHARDKRAKGYAPLVWATLFWTGLRHSEVQCLCKANPYGGLKWRDVLLDAEYPGIWTDPKWIGNKASTRDWIPLHPRLADLLRAHRATVIHTPEAPVFPVWPIRATWVDDRARAKLPAYDDEGRVLSVHATRATFITWLGKLSLPEGMVSRIARHNLSLAERVYTTRDKQAMAEAVAKLPDIWPVPGGRGTNLPTNPQTPPQGTCTLGPIGYSDSGESYEHSKEQHARTHGPHDSPSNGPGGSGVFSESRGRPVLGELIGRPFESLNPDSRIETADAELLKDTLRSLNLLIRGLASRGSIKESSDAAQQDHA